MILNSGDNYAVCLTFFLPYFQKEMKNSSTLTMLFDFFRWFEQDQSVRVVV